jgi:hypothetical protein
MNKVTSEHLVHMVQYIFRQMNFRSHTGYCIISSFHITQSKDPTDLEKNNKMIAPTEAKFDRANNMQHLISTVPLQSAQLHSCPGDWHLEHTI